MGEGGVSTHTDDVGNFREIMGSFCVAMQDSPKKGKLTNGDVLHENGEGTKLRLFSPVFVCGLGRREVQHTDYVGNFRGILGSFCVTMQDTPKKGKLTNGDLLYKNGEGTKLRFFVFCVWAGESVQHTDDVSNPSEIIGPFCGAMQGLSNKGKLTTREGRKVFAYEGLRISTMMLCRTHRSIPVRLYDAKGKLTRPSSKIEMNQNNNTKLNSLILVMLHLVPLDFIMRLIDHVIGK